MRYLALVATISSGLGACAPGDTPRDAPPEGVPAVVDASSPPLAPEIRFDDSVTVRLELPPPMARLLADSAPGFVPWSLAHYTPDVRGWALPKSRSALSVVIGDFNGDKVLDVVADGYDRSRTLQIALVSNAGGWLFITLHAHPLDTVPVPAANPYARLGEYLTLAPPGRYESNFEDEPLVLKSDGFYQVYFEKAAVLNYFDGRTLVSWVATD